jgi:hypothetical protein
MPTRHPRRLRVIRRRHHMLMLRVMLRVVHPRLRTRRRRRALSVRALRRGRRRRVRLSARAHAHLARACGGLLPARAAARGDAELGCVRRGRASRRAGPARARVRAASTGCTAAVALAVNIVVCSVVFVVSAPAADGEAPNDVPVPRLVRELRGLARDGLCAARGRWGDTRRRV